MTQYNGIAQRLYDAISIHDKFSILENEIKATSGFEGVIYLFLPKLSRLTSSLQPVFQYSESASELMKWYQENDCSRSDYTIRLIEGGRLDSIDYLEDTKLPPINDQELRVHQAMNEKFGTTRGLTFPALSNDLGIAAVSILSFKEEYENKKIDPALSTHIQNCVRIYHDHIMVHHDIRYEFILPILKTLSSKKKAVIKHLITGQPMKSITDNGVTKGYAAKLTIELRKTFGNISRSELIYLLGLLNIAEYL